MRIFAISSCTDANNPRQSSITAHHHYTHPSETTGIPGDLDRLWGDLYDPIPDIPLDPRLDWMFPFEAMRKTSGIEIGGWNARVSSPRGGF